jgi:hypothetical protein
MDPCQQLRARLPKIDNCNYVSALDLLHTEIGQINRRAHSRFRGFQLAAVTLDRANPGFAIPRLNDNLLATSQFCARQSSRHDRANSAQREHAIDEQARLSVIGRRLHRSEFACERAL